MAAVMSIKDIALHVLFVPMIAASVLAWMTSK
jgi:hypothetical protein